MMCQKKGRTKMKRSNKDEEDERRIECIIEKLFEDKRIKEIWKVLVKWKDYTVNRGNRQLIINEDQPEMIREYIGQISKKNKNYNEKEKCERDTTTSKKDSLQNRSHGSGRTVF